MSTSLLLEYYNRLLPGVPLVLMIASVIIGFMCAWRVEKRLDTFIKLLTWGMVFNAVRKLIIVFAYEDIEPWLPYTQYLDIVVTILFLAAFVELYRIIRSLNHER